ncbi:MAG: hypothetical protein GEV09_09490 [Pseudonocardiaceae bacterium]|nr:hypothetical protein [Pseudonocardiaceae bacterium]
MIRRPLAATAILAMLVTGCGGQPAPPQPPPSASAAASGADPVRWADAYCSGIGGAVEAALGLADPGARIDNAAKKQALLGYLEAAQAAYREAATRLEQLGPPAVAAGQQRQRAALEFYRGSLRAVQDQAERLAALDPAAPDFAQRFAEIERSGFDAGPLQQELDALRTDPALQEALQQAAACKAIEQRLGGGGAGGSGGADGG